MKQKEIETIVEIQGKTIYIKCAEEDVSRLERAAEYLENRIKAQKTCQTLATDRLILVTALNLTNELLAQSEKREQEKQTVQDLQVKLEQALTRFSQMELEPVSEI